MKLADIYQDAMANHYALGAFNFCNLENMKAILNTAEKLVFDILSPFLLKLSLYQD